MRNMIVKMKTIIWLVAIALLFTIIIYGLSQFEIRKTLSIPYSQSIQVSKQNGAFLWSYKCPKEVRVSDSITLAFKEAFAEYIGMRIIIVTNWIYVKMRCM